MRKIISLVFILFLLGCSKEEYFTCKFDVNNKQMNYNFTGTYKIYYDDNYVTKIEKEEKYISPDESVLNYYEEYKDLDNYNLNDKYGGVTYKIERQETNVDLNIVMDVSNMNIKQMVKDKVLDKDYVISNKLTITGAKYLYKSKGANCDI